MYRLIRVAMWIRKNSMNRDNERHLITKPLMGKVTTRILKPVLMRLKHGKIKLLWLHMYITN